MSYLCTRCELDEIVAGVERVTTRRQAQQHTAATTLYCYACSSNTDHVPAPDDANRGGDRTVSVESDEFDAERGGELRLQLGLAPEHDYDVDDHGDGTLVIQYWPADGWPPDE